MRESSPDPRHRIEPDTLDRYQPMTHVSTLNPTLAPESNPSSASKATQPSLRVVAIGGGTGLSTLLRGLKRYVPAPAAFRRSTDASSRLPSGALAEPVPNPTSSDADRPVEQS